MDERQAAVEAILDTGHIPAGMELFKASNESQLDTVKRWIDESDIYFLILGGRYGSIEPISGKSYTHLEYEYAVENNKPFFAVVMKDSALNEKVKTAGLSVFEQENQTKFKGFKELATSKMCKFFDDNKDIKLAIHSSIQELMSIHEFDGWVSGKELKQLLIENNELKKQTQEVRSKSLISSNDSSENEDSLEKVEFNILKDVYDISGGLQHKIAMLEDLGTGEFLSIEEKERIASFLHSLGFIKYVTLDGGISITSQGISFIKKILNKLTQLTELESLILKTVYDKDFYANGNPKMEMFIPLLYDQDSRNPELAYYILKMARSGLLTFDNEPFIKGGRLHSKYNNNVINIMFDRIYITEKGSGLARYM